MEMEEKVLAKASVCLLVKDDHVLLAKKTRKIGAGCWNGYGGGIEEGETPLEGAIRELEEESGIVAHRDYCEEMAVVDFHNTKSDGETFICRVHFFLVKDWEGEPVETDEMIAPTFFHKDKLPLGEMMPADREFLPLILAGKKITVKAKYGPFQKELLGEVEIVEEGGNL
ncbi:MAG TPA: NUDIX domain-containing protein [Candidatus Paceibacterota bacterium]|nr:NUDIX domain-containing protein [Candidatus Paceibacterota bacterium]